MSFDAIPLWGVFLGTVVLVGVALEAGFRLGGAVRRRRPGEAQSAGVVSGSVLGLAAFMLAFTVGMVSDRFDARRALVREDANAIRTAWRRADFLPDADRAEAVALLRRYVDQRVKFAEAGRRSGPETQAALADAEQTHERLWGMAVANARLDMNSDVAALYVDALNEMARVHATRVAVSLQSRTPDELWILLYAVTLLGVMAMGYHNAVDGSRRAMSQSALVVSFALVMTMIASLDRPDSGILRVNQRPLVELRQAMEAAATRTAR